MSLTVEARRWHEEYEKADPLIRTAVDVCYRKIRNHLFEQGFTAAKDDRAETLVAAIMEYITESAEAN